MGKGDQKSRRGKVTAGSYGKRRPRKANSVKKIPVTVMDENENEKSKVAVRQEVGYPDDKSENADPPTDVKPKAAKPKTADKPKPKKTEE
ncbi:30S ribosomal protein THX [Kaistella pullorum]|uniref:30S ribosomal protein THX n=1 Tax=Kaistella pullorum TaxID=2763074 RepID=A0ABR8WP00_9FLAO|nr:30S ribosomal protein THX [Kaistella pullorum]MBD8018799.1 30S ribosomal protein THX [Kaistella pullorum]